MDGPKPEVIQFGWLCWELDNDYSSVSFWPGLRTHRHVFWASVLKKANGEVVAAEFDVSSVSSVGACGLRNAHQF